MLFERHSVKNFKGLNVRGRLRYAIKIRKVNLVQFIQAHKEVDLSVKENQEPSPMVPCTVRIEVTPRVTFPAKNIGTRAQLAMDG